MSATNGIFLSAFFMLIPWSSYGVVTIWENRITAVIFSAPGGRLLHLAAYAITPLSIASATVWGFMSIPWPMVLVIGVSSVIVSSLLANIVTRVPGFLVWTPLLIAMNIIAWLVLTP